MKSILSKVTCYSHVNFVKKLSAASTIFLITPVITSPKFSNTSVGIALFFQVIPEKITLNGN